MHTRLLLLDWGDGSSPEHTLAGQETASKLTLELFMNDKSIFRRRVFIALLVLLVVAAASVGGYFAYFGWKTPGSPLESVSAEQQTHSEEEGEDSVLTVKVVRPKLNKQQLVSSVTQPAYVSAMYKANLMTRVAGVVKTVHKDIGEPIKTGDVLIDIDVPELVQDLALKRTLVKLAEEELRSSEANVNAVRASAREARVMIEEKQADVERSMSKKRYHQSVYRRVKSLADQRAVEASLVDERLKNVEAADADLRSANASVETARANADEFSAKLAQAQVEVKVRQARIDVAKAEVAKAQTLVDYAKVRAPFDGMVVERKVDPGAFVQNASTGHPDALMTVVRTDKVTLVMWVPERAAPLVTEKTEATIRLDALGGREISTHVTRSSGWFDPDKSRDMRVEVDLDNPDRRLKPGMYGSMRLVLQRFDRALLLPASAVFVRSRQTYICEVVDGKAKLVKVKVQQEDGIRVKVVKLIATPGGEDTIQELTGTEKIVRSGQGEIHDGQELQATEMEW